MTREMVMYFANKAKKSSDKYNLTKISSGEVCKFFNGILILVKKEWNLFNITNHWTVFEFLQNYPRIAKSVTLSELVSFIPRIKPRIYCIASHPEV